MKKFIAVILAFTLLFVLAGCGPDSNTNTTEPTSAPDTSTPEQVTTTPVTTTTTTTEEPTSTTDERAESGVRVVFTGEALDKVAISDEEVIVLFTQYQTFPMCVVFSPEEAQMLEIGTNYIVEMRGKEGSIFDYIDAEDAEFLNRFNTSTMLSIFSTELELYSFEVSDLYGLGRIFKVDAWSDRPGHSLDKSFAKVDYNVSLPLKILGEYEDTIAGDGEGHVYLLGGDRNYIMVYLRNVGPYEVGDYLTLNCSGSNDDEQLIDFWAKYDDFVRTISDVALIDLVNFGQYNNYEYTEGEGELNFDFQFIPVE